MATHPFFDMLGLDNPRPEDHIADLEKKAVRIKHFMQRLAEAMVRCRCKIERLRQRVESSPRDFRQGALEEYESRYQQLLGRMAKAKRKLRESQNELGRHSL
ncbi:MAG TPA: hypothetical protein VKS79_25200 [Gemmataceae bacterium]|nr:hypothetical protein [Gemmataceae bacterium]